MPRMELPCEPVIAAPVRARLGAVPEPLRIPTTDELAQLVGERLFGKPTVQNNFRGELVETIVALALGDEWLHCAADWAGWDFQSAQGLRLQVRQSAAKQTWISTKAMRPSYSIKAAAGYWEGPLWHARPGRQTDIYVFAWHPLTTEDADHRDIGQWRFWVVAERDLPPKQKSISLKTLERKFGSGVSFHELARAVTTAAATLRT